MIVADPLGGAVIPPPAPRPAVIWLGVPTFGVVSVPWHLAMMQLQTPLNRTVRHCYVAGREVGEARNDLVRRALAYRGPSGERVSHVLFIDDDVIVPADTVARLLAHDLPLVSGLYYAKTEAEQPLILGPMGTGTRRDWQPGDLVACEAHGMGCTLIAREVFEALDPPWFASAMAWVGSDADGVPIWRAESEDVWFCRRARRAGIHPVVDTGLFCWHWSLTEHRAYPLARWREAVRRGEAPATAYVPDASPWDGRVTAPPAAQAGPGEALAVAAATSPWEGDDAPESRLRGQEPHA
jgi:hypothetical protein